jgi:hypothetical protein
MERRIRYGIVLLIFLIVTLCVYGIFFRSSSTDRFIATADFAMTAGELAASFDRNEAQSDRLYLYKVLSVTGQVQKIQKDESGAWSVTLGPSLPGATVVECQLDSQFNAQYSALQTGDSLRLLGICTGRLKDVILVQSIIEK